jgi:DNA helicase IV
VSAASNRLSPSDITIKVAGTGSQRVRAFLQVFVPIFEAYENNLRSRGDLDFEDMVNLSASAFREGQLHHPYRLILVDEFQDVSNNRAELISAMLSQSSDIRLFGVGDDWQSIYRFAGADVTAMTQFGSRFGYTATNHLTLTFRSNQHIADAASNFIMRNPVQLQKKIRASSPGSSTSIEVVFHTGSPESFLEQEFESLAQQHGESGKRPSVLLLGRYNFLEPESLGLWQRQYEDLLDLSFLTIHRAKGLEADIVFLLGASNKKGQDFPSTIQDDPLLSLFMPVADHLAWAEERRLFYVALTRARHKVYIVSPEGQASPFVSELVSTQAVSQSLYSGRQKTAIEDARPFLRLHQCPQCEKGSIMRRTSQFGLFEFCTLKCGYKRNLMPSETN